MKKKGVINMGGGSYSSKDWDTFSTTRKYDDPKTTVEDVYKKTTIDGVLDPRKWKVRESVDGPDNPESTPLILGLDVTGSMDLVLDSIARKGMKTVCEEIYKRKLITNPHICVLGIGDVECDNYPFQATQFEADIRIFEQLEKLYLERGGGGNSHESYILAWYFAQYRTKTDSYSKRGRKGFIFTIGDEEITPRISESNFKKHLDDYQMRTFSAQELFEMVSAEWNIYHIIIKEGSHARYDFNGVLKSWSDVIGMQRVIPLDDHTKVAETIISILEMMAGKSKAEVVSSWSGDTSIVINAAIKEIGTNLVTAQKPVDSYL